MQTPLYLYTPFYHDKNPDRMAELEYCLAQNKANPCIDGIVLFVDDPERYRNYAISPRISLARTAAPMPSYNDFLRHAQEQPGPFCLIIANSDICFDETIRYSRELSWRPRELWCLTRREGTPDIHPPLCEHIQSSDVWIVTSPAPLLPLDIQLGKLHCESAAMYQFETLGYTVTNASLEIHAFHVHASQSRNYNPHVDRYEDRSRMTFPVVGSKNPPTPPLLRSKSKILLDTAIFTTGPFGPARWWNYMLRAISANPVSDTLIVADQGALPRSITFPHITHDLPLNAHLPASSKRVIDSVAEKVGAGTYVTTAYQTGQRTPSVVPIYDLCEFVSLRETELSMKKYLAIAMADKLLFFNPKVQEQCWEVFPHSRALPQIVLSPTIPPTLKPEAPSFAGQPPYIVIDDASITPGMNSGIDQLLVALSQIPERPRVIFPYFQPDTRTAGFAASLGVSCEYCNQTDPAAYLRLIQGALAVVIPYTTPLFDGVAVDALMCDTPIITLKRAGNPITTGGCSIELDSLQRDEFGAALRMVSQPDVRASLQQKMRDRVPSFHWRETVERFITFIS